MCGGWSPSRPQYATSSLKPPLSKFLVSTLIHRDHSPLSSLLLAGTIPCCQAMATSDTQRHAPAFNPKSEVARAIEIASDLCLIEDPPEEPFRSKYKARDVLIKAKQSHAREAATGSGAVSGLVACGCWGQFLEWSRFCQLGMGVCPGYLKEYSALARGVYTHIMTTLP